MNFLPWFHFYWTFLKSSSSFTLPFLPNTINRHLLMEPHLSSKVIFWFTPPSPLSDDIWMTIKAMELRKCTYIFSRYCTRPNFQHIRLIFSYLTYLQFTDQFPPFMLNVLCIYKYWTIEYLISFNNSKCERIWKFHVMIKI